MALLLLCAAIAACAPLGPNYQRPPLALQSQWSDAAPDGKAAVATAQDWWRQFDDPVLLALLQKAREGNPGLQSAAQRIVQAQAQLGITQTGELPSAQFSAGANYTNPDIRSQLLNQQEGSTNAQMLLQASWEPDFWGRVRRAVESDTASWYASMAAYQAALVSLEGSIGSTYFNLRTLEQRLAVARGNLAQQGESLRIAEARFRAGATSELDRRQAQAQYDQTAAQIPGLQSSIRQAGHALSVLAGQAPDYYRRSFVERGAMPTPPDGLPASLPRELLSRRPDVLQAEFAAVAQGARIGQAQAALYPSFSLGGSFGLQASDAGSSQLSDIFSWRSQARSLTAGLLLPIFDRGRLVNQVRVQDALFEQALLAYEAQVLKAQQEVEDALAGIAGSTTALQSLVRAREAARRSAALAMQRYKSGANDYTTVTTAEQARLQTEDALTQTEGNLLQAYVAAFRALGGGWDGVLRAPEIAAPVAQRMQGRTGLVTELATPSSAMAPIMPPASSSIEPSVMPPASTSRSPSP